MCWKDEDRGRILMCDNCDQEYHIYCLNPPLSELPEADGELHMVVSNLSIALICTHAGKQQGISHNKQNEKFF